MTYVPVSQVRKLMVAGAAVVALMGVSPGVSLAVGGGGGNAFTLNCSDGRALVGIRGRAGDFIDSVRGVCKRFDEIGNGSDTETTALVGGTGGNSYELRCPSGEVVVGLKGRAAWMVDRLQLVCGAINEDGRVIGDGRSDPFTAGGTGGDAFNLLCPHPVGQSSLSMAAVGLKGRAGSWLDNITIICGTPTVDQLAPVDPDRPDLRVSVRGLPFRVRDGQSVEYTTIMRNVGRRTNAGAELDLATEMPISFPIIEVPFLAQGGCDVHDTPPPPVFVRCTAGGVDGNWGGQQISVTVTFTADTTGTFDFSAIADPRNRVTEGIGGGGNNTRHETLRVVQ